MRIFLLRSLYSLTTRSTTGTDPEPAGRASWPQLAIRALLLNQGRFGQDQGHWPKQKEVIEPRPGNSDELRSRFTQLRPENDQFLICRMQNTSESGRRFEKRSS